MVEAARGTHDREGGAYVSLCGDVFPGPMTLVPLGKGFARSRKGVEVHEIFVSGDTPAWTP